MIENKDLQNYLHSVSVIVPVYNTRNYLHKCVKSLFNQSIQGLELIFLDDASTDDSVQVLENALSQYSNASVDVTVKCFDVNRGQALLREEAKSLATGRYVIHCDSDDWLDSGLLEKMYEKAVSENLDIVTCDIKYIYPDGNTRVWTQNCFSAEKLCSGIIRSEYSGFLSNKLIKHEILTKAIIVPTINMGEDWACSVQYAFYARSVGHVSNAFYNNLRHEGSTSFCEDKPSALKRYFDFKSNFDIVTSFVRQKDVERRYYEDVLFRCINMRQGLMKYMDDKHCLRMWRDTNPEMTSDILMAKSISVHDKLVFLIVLMGLYTMYMRVKKFFG